MSAQEDKSRFSLGFNYGFGSEFNNRNYTFTNHFYKIQLYYKLKQKRAQYTQLKDIREYVVNCGFLVRKPIGEICSFYILGSIGPMITDTETERMSKGFAFADVLAVGFSLKHNKIQFDIRPNIRHVSNGGLSGTNSGYNTRNIEFGVSYSL
jgi:hypothetical protein